MENATLHAQNPEEQMWGALAHFAGLAGFVIPGGGMLATLAIWLTKGRQSPYLELQSREAANFQISALLAGLVAIALLYVAIGVFMLVAVILADLICITRGTLAGSRGEVHIYPASLRLIRPRR